MSLEQFILENELSFDMIDFIDIDGKKFIVTDDGEFVEIEMH